MSFRPGRVSNRNASTGTFDDENYDAIRDAKAKYFRNFEHYRSKEVVGTSAYVGDDRSQKKQPGRPSVVIEHWPTGCRGQSVCDNLILAIEDYDPDVKVKEFRGRPDSFEVFINGKMIYSRLVQGGYPDEDEVRDAIYRARRGKTIYPIDRFEGGSPMCNIL